MLSNFTPYWFVNETQVSNTDINGLSDVIVSATVLCTLNGEMPECATTGIKAVVGETEEIRMTFTEPSAEVFTPIDQITKETILAWCFEHVDKEEIEKRLQKRLEEKYAFLDVAPPTRMVTFS